MMTMPSFPKLARRNIILLASCLGVLLVFASVVLVPDIHKHRHQVRARQQLQARLNEQNDLNSLHRQLEAKLIALSKLDIEPPAKPEPLPAREMNQIVLTLQELAAKEGVVFDDIRPAITTGRLPLHRMRIQAILHGHLEQHRALLLDLLREPYVDEIEQLTIEANGSDITLRIILAINIA